MENIEKMIDAIAAGNYTEAGETMNSILADKLNDTLDAERVNVASRMFGQDVDVDDDEIDQFNDFEDDDEEENDEDEED